MKGWVYVISNKAMVGLVKVGYSLKDPELRAVDLNHTGCPHPYVVEYEMLIDEPCKIEQKTHKLLSINHEGKEWFRCSPEEAVAAIKSTSGTGVIAETYKRAEQAKADALLRQKLQEKEAARVRQKSEKELADRLLAEEALIQKGLKDNIVACVPPRPFWHYWLVGGTLVALVSSLIPQIPNSSILVFSVIIGAIVGFPLQEFFEERREQSSS